MNTIEIVNSARRIVFQGTNEIIQIPGKTILIHQAGMQGIQGPPGPPGTGETDHGALTGLSDDDHSQYHNDTRGDARYYTKSQVDTSLSGKSNTGHSHNDLYYTEAEVNALVAGLEDSIMIKARSGTLTHSQT